MEFRPSGRALLALGFIAVLLGVIQSPPPCRLHEADSGSRRPAFPIAAALAATGDLLDRVLDHFPDTTVAVRAMEEDPATFRVSYDSLLARTDLENKDVRDVLAWAAEVYLAATGDSLLLDDFRFVDRANPGDIRLWSEAVTLDAQGFALRDEGDHEASATAFRRAAEAYRALGCLRREAVVWGSLGVSIWNTGDYRAAGDAYANALEARQRLGDPVLIGRTLNALGSVELQLGNLRGALDYYERARQVRESLDDPIELGTTLTYLGHVQYRFGNLEEAQANYQKALELYGKDAPVPRLNDLRGGLANVLSILGDRKEALALYRQVLESWLEVGDARKAALIRGNIGAELIQMGDFTGALRELNQARDDLETSGDLHALAATMNSIGRTYHLLGDVPAALRAYEDARRFGEESGNAVEIVAAMNNQAGAYHLLGLDDRALGMFDETLAAAREAEYWEAYRDALHNKAIVFESQGEHAPALDLYRQALARDLESGNRVGEALEYLSIGNTLAGLGRLEEGERSLRQALALSIELDQRTVVWACYLGIADCHEQADRLDSARVYNAKAIETLESMRGRSLSEESRTAFLGSKAFVYEAQIHVLAKLHAGNPGAGFAEEAWRVAEQGKARAFLELLTEGRVDRKAGAPPRLASDLDRVDRALNATGYRIRLAESQEVSADSLRQLKRELKDLEEQQEAILDRIRLESPRVNTLSTGDSCSLADVRRELLPGSNDVLLEYALGDSASYLWVVTGKNFTVHALPPRANLEARSNALRTAVSDPTLAGDDGFLEPAWDLYRVLLAPAEAEIRDAQSITVVPDGALHAVPFEVLLSHGVRAGAFPESPADRGTALAGLPYALGEIPIRYGPSASSLVAISELRTRRAQEGPLRFLGMGDPAFGNPDSPDSTASSNVLAPLPWSRDEVESIAGLFAADSRTILMGSDVQESRLKEPGFLSHYRCIHFATHGLIDELRPERSSLALSWPRGSSEDGYLRASEIYGLELAADLVVLSACETGRGKSVPGEGILGLPRAFFFAGASSVVVSLWSVSDRSTTEFMKLFYEELVDRKRPTSEALTRAKERLRETGEFAHPFYWAPFVLLGIT